MRGGSSGRAPQHHVLDGLFRRGLELFPRAIQRALILLGRSHLHSHVERISSKLGRAQVTIGDYSVELTGLASTTNRPVGDGLPV